MLSFTKSCQAGKTFLHTLFFFLLVSQISFAKWVQTNRPNGDPVLALAISGNNIFAGTWRNGVGQRPISEMTAVETNNDNLPTEFALEQNFPNLFNPSTKLKCSVTQALIVQIKVYDVLDNEIETVINEEKPAGTYEVTWYAEKLPGGVYFYQLRTGKFIQTRK